MCMHVVFQVSVFFLHTVCVRIYRPPIKRYGIFSGKIVSNTSEYCHVVCSSERHEKKKKITHTHIHNRTHLACGCQKRFEVRKIKKHCLNQPISSNERFDARISIFQTKWNKNKVNEIERIKAHFGNIEILFIFWLKTLLKKIYIFQMDFKRCDDKNSTEHWWRCVWVQ